MSKLIAQITNDPVSNNPREAEMFEMKITREWEIDVSTDIYEKNANGNRLFDAALTIPGLTDQNVFH